MLGQDITGSTLKSNDTFGVAGLVRRASALVAAAVTAITLNGNAVAAVGDPSIVSYVDNYLGIAGELINLPGAGIEINHDPVAGQSEALALNLGKAYNTVTVTVGALQPQEGPGGLYREWGAWEAFDTTGSPIGEDTFYGPQTEVTINAPGMQYLVFTARPYTLRTLNDGDTASPPDQGPGPDGGPNCSTGQACDSSDYYLLTLSAEGLSLPATGLTGDEAWAAVSPTGFESTTDYTEGGRFVDAPLSVSGEECAGNTQENNVAGCELPVTPRLRTFIQNAPDAIGSIAVKKVLQFIDPRAQCGAVGGPTGALDMSSFPELGLAPGTGPFIPAYLCGNTDPVDGKSKFFFVDIENIDFTTVRSVLEHELTLDADSEYQCAYGQDILKLPAAARDLRRSQLPVIAWLPKQSGNEIPVQDRNGVVVRQMQDITYGCGSSRGGTNRYSYFAYDLHHVQATDYRPVLRSALEQLKATISQTSQCVDPRRYNGMAFGINVVLFSYDSRWYSLAKLQLQALLVYMESSLLDAELQRCYFDLNSNTVIVEPGDAENVVPRNFRGDLIVQARHALYMFGRMLGVVTPRLPDDFKGL